MIASGYISEPEIGLEGKPNQKPFSLRKGVDSKSQYTESNPSEPFDVRKQLT